MKSKTLLNIAVASTLGMSAAAFAGPGHDKWVAAGEEQYPAMIFGTESPRGIAGLEVSSISIEPVGGTASSFESSLGGSFASDTALDATMSSDELSPLTMDESLALADEGVYSDFILTSVPVTFESWDLYVLDDSQLGADQLAALDDFMIQPYDLAVIEVYIPSDASPG